MENFKKRDVVEAILVSNKNEILLQKKTIDYEFGPGEGCIFGGVIEEGETLEQALKREIKEELGIEIKGYKLFEVADYQAKGYAGKRHVFVVNINKNISDIKITEGAGFAFFDKSELESLKIIKPCKESLKRCFGL